MHLHPVYRILATLLPLVARCSADASENASLDLSKSIPECAQACVDNFIKTQYSPEDCTSPSDTECICRTLASDGLTLGEAALGCVYALCSAKVVKSSNVYHVCDSVSGAQAGTHATITATTFAAPASTSSTAVPTRYTASYSSENVLASSTSSSLTTASSIAPEITPSSSSSGGGPGVIRTSTGQATGQSTASSTTSSTTPSPTPNEEEQKSAVSPAAVIGVSVSSGLAGCFIIVVAVVFCCRRWRRKNESRADEPESGHHFEIGGSMAEPPGFSRASFHR